MRTNADRDALFAQVFGPQLLQETVGDRLQFDNTYSAGRRLDHLARLDGKPVLGMWLSAGIFFYQPTMLDLTTGAVYQGDIVPGHVYAPLLPPSDVRLSGDFTPSQIALLKKALSAF